MSITSKSALGIAAALFAFGAACDNQKRQEAGDDTSKTSLTQTPSTQQGTNGGPSAFSQEPLITDVSESELAQFFSSIPDGRGLPPGSGTVAQGEKVYTAQCAACHGTALEGGLGDKLIGGRGTLAAKSGNEPLAKTVESYWPYATTLFDYIKRSMPFHMPGSLSNDEAVSYTHLTLPTILLV